MRRLSTGQKMVLVFAPFSLAYFLSYLVGNVNSTLSEPLTQAFDLSKAELGSMSAAYFLSFTLVQIPLGLAMDRWGPRAMQSILYCVAALGCASFAMADGFLTLTLSRFLIGLGVAGGLMCSLKALSLWFDRQHLPLVNNLMLAVGGLGSMAATYPVQVLTEIWPWTRMFWLVAALCLLVPTLLVFVTPQAQTNAAQHGAPHAHSLLSIARRPSFYMLAPGACFTMAAGTTVQSLWVGPWIDDHLSLDGTSKSLLLMALNASFVVTALGMGWLATHVFRSPLALARLIVFGTGLGAVAFLLLAVLPTRLALWGFPLMILAQNTTFLMCAFLTQAVGAASAGKSNSLVNVSVFALVWALMFLLGLLLDALVAKGMALPQAYAVGFTSLAAVLLITCALGGWHVTRRRDDIHG